MSDVEVRIKNAHDNTVLDVAPDSPFRLARKLPAGDRRYAQSARRGPKEVDRGHRPWTPPARHPRPPRGNAPESQAPIWGRGKTFLPSNRLFAIPSCLVWIADCARPADPRSRAPISVAPVFAVSAFSPYQCSTRSCEQAPNNRQIAEEWFRADKGRTAVAVQSKTEAIGEHR